MKIRRTLATASASLLLLASLTACFGLPGGLVPGGGGGTDPDPDTPAETDLTGTTWSGVDSDGESWTFEFQTDGTVGLTYEGDSYDDETDTWAVSGGTLSIVLAFNEGDVEFTGPVAADAIDLDATYPDGTFTLTITQD